MKRKIILLILIIPIILIFTTNLVTKKTSILVEVPVSKVEVIGEKYRFIDLASIDENSLLIETNVYPKEASQKVNYEKVLVEGQKEAKVLLNDNMVVPCSDGVIKINVKAGDKYDSVVFNFYSSLTLDKIYQFSKNEIVIEVGDFGNISDYITNVTDEFINSNVPYNINSFNILDFDVFTGDFIAINEGNVEISISYDYLLVVNEKISKEKETIVIKVIVEKKEG